MQASTSPLDAVDDGGVQIELKARGDVVSEWIRRTTAVRGDETGNDGDLVRVDRSVRAGVERTTLVLDETPKRYGAREMPNRVAELSPPLDE
jgi:hypothetical protein